MDPRLRLAVDASRAWYDDVFALHRLPTASDGRLWWSLVDPPPYHSKAKTLQSGVPASAVLAAVGEHGSVADSFADLELPDFTMLFEATWVHHPGGSSGALPARWSIVTTMETLELWSQHHDYLGVLTAPVLDRPAFTVLGCYDGSDLVGGAVLHQGGSGAVGLSNTWTLPGHALDWEELLAAAHAIHPGMALTDYAGGEELSGLLDAGFQAVGTQRVWAR